jgi:hypothetical protein
MRWLVAIACLLFASCTTAPPVVLPPEIIEVPKYMPLPAECGKKAEVDLPVGSTPNDVMSKQKTAIDELEAQIERCYRPPS